mmetsp:Transcript_75511/g.233148  ORF Transcript_75511/g.233148 Transcript_75511/m.233148 type:complete len:414 (+) Transcript_75511:277-1518(+)
MLSASAWTWRRSTPTSRAQAGRSPRLTLLMSLASKTRTSSKSRAAMCETPLPGERSPGSMRGPPHRLLPLLPPPRRPRSPLQPLRGALRRSPSCRLATSATSTSPAALTPRTSRTCGHPAVSWARVPATTRTTSTSFTPPMACATPTMCRRSCCGRSTAGDTQRPSSTTGRIPKRSTRWQLGCAPGRRSGGPRRRRRRPLLLQRRPPPLQRRPPRRRPLPARRKETRRKRSTTRSGTSWRSAWRRPSPGLPATSAGCPAGFWARASGMAPTRCTSSSGRQGMPTSQTSRRATSARSGPGTSRRRAGRSRGTRSRPSRLSCSWRRRRQTARRSRRRSFGRSCSHGRRRLRQRRRPQRQPSASANSQRSSQRRRPRRRQRTGRSRGSGSWPAGPRRRRRPSGWLSSSTRTGLMSW